MPFRIRRGRIYTDPEECFHGGLEGRHVSDQSIDPFYQLVYTITQGVYTLAQAFIQFLDIRPQPDKQTDNEACQRKKWIPFAHLSEYSKVSIQVACVGSLVAGTQRYSVGTDTPRVFATSR